MPRERVATQFEVIRAIVLEDRQCGERAPAHVFRRLDRPVPSQVLDLVVHQGLLAYSCGRHYPQGSAAVGHTLSCSTSGRTTMKPKACSTTC